MTLTKKERCPFIPHDVAYMVARQNVPLVKAWRIRLGMTIEEIATAAEMPSEEIRILETKRNTFSLPLMRVAFVMNLDIDQLTDILH
ncbi:MAG TPA: XRE family transcriptional regulator [Desulfobacteraceae bacterium]|nr:XRE family transcriptional regulator [Desulfobacteraceae bacterium]